MKKLVELFLRNAKDLTKFLPITEGGLYVHLHVDDALTICTETLKRVILSTRVYNAPLILHIHITATGRKGRAAALKQLEPYLRDLTAIVWDQISVPGLRSHVRYWSFESMKRVYTKWVIPMDGDYTRMTYFNEPGSPKTREDIKFINWYPELKKMMLEGFADGGLMVTPKDLNNNMEPKSKGYGKEGLMRSGCYPMDLAGIVAKYGADFNPFYEGYLRNFETNEDLFASCPFLEDGVLRVVRWIAITGARESNKKPSMANINSYAHCQWHHDDEIMRKSLLNFTTENMKTNQKNEFNEWLVDFRLTITKVKKDEGVDRFPYSEPPNVDTLINETLRLYPTGKFARVFTHHILPEQAA